MDNKIDDLKLIKKYYGEKMMQLCRRLFPTLLEKEGQLIGLIESKFAHSKLLYDDIIEDGLVDDFKDYIYSLTASPVEPIDTNKSVQQLMNDAGYDFFECETEKDIQNFKKYYNKGEELCTFYGGRLKTCHVFFAVKKNVDYINRQDYTNPKRQDEYGTSVISIQFTRGENNTLSIKNRYNHTVANPDATFRNNLENIIPGLTIAFEKQYGFNIMQNANDFKIDDYVIAGDGKFYKYTEETNNIYYGPNNIIIDHFKVQKEFLDKSRYLIIGVLVLDMQDKKIYRYDKNLRETLPEYLENIVKINIINKENGYKDIVFLNSDNEERHLIIDNKNRIVGYIDNYSKEFLEQFFMWYSRYITYFEAQNLRRVGDGFLNGGMYLTEFIAPNLEEVGIGFLAVNSNLERLDCPKLKKVGYNFMRFHPKFKINNFDKRVTCESKVKFVKVLISNQLRRLGGR